MSTEKPPLYTNESIVFRSGITNADVSVPITVVNDAGGNHLLQDGNHRAKRSELTGEPLERIIIGDTSIMLHKMKTTDASLS